MIPDDVAAEQVVTIKRVFLDPPKQLRTQLRFLTEDLANALEAVGVAIRAAKTEEEAMKAFKPYADQLAA